MIDYENYIFTQVATALRTEIPGIYVTGMIDDNRESYPKVSFLEASNRTAERYQDNTLTEHYSDVMYEAQAYSNKSTGRKAEVKKIIAVIDGVMQGFGFTRVLSQPMPNVADLTIARHVGRWQATIGTDGIVYRR